ncbi:SIMPL domain-containing protein [Patescibacteria group bacterium]|nr:SIMPL domain-containing protein [Patescibacteria group bacterium]
MFFSKPTLITVSAEGKVTTQPEEVKFIITITAQANSVPLAIATQKRISAKVFSTLKDYKVKENDLKISYLRIDSLTANTYQASQAISITLIQPDKFEEVLEKLYIDGIASIETVRFTTVDSEDLEKEAIKKAIENVELRGKEIAKSMGKKLGRMISLSTEETGEASTAVSNLTLSEISKRPKEIEINRVATAVYEIK